jgi:hypothetical protein
MAQDMQSKLEDKLFLAAENGNLKIFKHMMNSPSIRKHINIAENGYQTLKSAARHCDEEFLDYILTIPEVDEIIMTKIISATFANACYKENFDIINYYFNNEKYGKYLDLTYNATQCFRTAYANDRKDVLQFLIINANLPKNSNVILEIARGNGHSEEFVNMLFIRREMKEELTKDLSKKEATTQTIKKI